MIKSIFMEYLGSGRYENLPVVKNEPSESVEPNFGLEQSMHMEDIDSGHYDNLPIVKTEPSESEEPNHPSEEASSLPTHVTTPYVPSEFSDEREDDPPSLSSEQALTDEVVCSYEAGYIKEEPDWSAEYVLEQESNGRSEGRSVIKAESGGNVYTDVPGRAEYKLEKHFAWDYVSTPLLPSSQQRSVSEEREWAGIVKSEEITGYAGSDEQLSYASSLSTCRDTSAMDDTIIKGDPYLFDNCSVRTESANFVMEQSSIASRPVFDECCSEDVVLGVAKAVAAVPSSRGRKGKKRKSKGRPKHAVPKASSSFTRQPRKKKSQNEYVNSSVNINLLPRRSSNRLRRKQIEHVVDYSHLPPKFTGPLLPSMHFCHYVLEQLMSAKYEPINWLIDLATVKKKLDYRQYEDANEFAAEIRSICMNPLEDSLADDSLSLLRSFEQLWLYMPLDPELPLVPEGAEDMDELELKYSAMLATLINNTKKCQFYGNQLSLHLQRVKDIAEAQRVALQQNGPIPEIPPNMKADIEALALKLQPYTSIPIDLLMESDLMHSPDRLLSAIAPVAPELMEMLREKMKDKSDVSAPENPPNDNHFDQDGEEMLTKEKQEELVRDIELLSDDDKITVLGIIASDDNVEVRFDDEEFHVELSNAKTSTFRMLLDCVSALKQRQLTCKAPQEDCASSSEVEWCTEVKSKGIVGNKRTRTSSKSTVTRKQTQPAKKRAIDIEARKRELVEGIKKLGGTGMTRPIRKQVPYVEPRSRIRTSYVYRSSSSSSSESTTNSDSWESGSTSDTEAE